MNAKLKPELGPLMLSASRLSDREILSRLGISTLQFSLQIVFVLLMMMIFGGVGPVFWLAAQLGHEVHRPVWKDPLWGPILVAWCLVLYSLFFAFVALVRRRQHLAIHERGFRIGRRTIAYADIREVRFGRSDGKFASALKTVNAAIPLARNQAVDRLGRRSSAFSMALVMKNGQVVPLNNFFACYPNEALECVVGMIASKLPERSSGTAGRDGQEGLTYGTRGAERDVGADSR